MLKRFVLIIATLAASGCASAGINGSCAHIGGNEMSAPYIGGKLNGDGYVCHMGCFGPGCTKPDYAAFSVMMSTYIKEQATDNKFTTTGPGTITFTPAK